MKAPLAILVPMVVPALLGGGMLVAAHQGWSLPSLAVKADPAAPAQQALPEADSARATYVGATMCRACHSKEYKAWQGTAHAHAFQTLTTGDSATMVRLARALKVNLGTPPHRNDGCISCHVTGMGKTGGWPAADSAKHAALTHVTCESCHGPGSLHVTARADMRKATIRNTGTAAMCTPCHTPITSPKFDFESYKARGVHTVLRIGR